MSQNETEELNKSLQKRESIAEAQGNAQEEIQALIASAGLEPTLENASAIYALTETPDDVRESLNLEGRHPYRFAKRAFDMAASACGMILLSWLIVGTAVAVKITSPGPVIFKQQRVGKNKELFDIYKFRTMRIDTPDLPSHMIDANDWLTPIGAVMRRLSLAPVIIGTPGDGEPTKSLSHPENSSLDLQKCERRPGTSLGARHHYTSFQFLSFAVFGGPEGTSGRHLCAFARAPFAAVGTVA